MPIQSKIDTPGALRHIMARGVERLKVFRDYDDRDHFLERLCDIRKKTDTACYPVKDIRYIHSIYKRLGKQVIRLSGQTNFI